MNRIISRALLFLMASASTHAFQPSSVVQTRRRSATMTALSSSTKHDDKDRRQFLTASAAAFLSSPFLWGLSTSPAQAADALDYKAVSADIAELIQKNPDWAPVRVNGNDNKQRRVCARARTLYYTHRVFLGRSFGMIHRIANLASWFQILRYYYYYYLYYYSTIRPLFAWPGTVRARTIRKPRRVDPVGVPFDSSRNWRMGAMLDWPIPPFPGSNRVRL